MSLRGIYGGTFDPIHLGHLRTAWEVAVTIDMPVHMVLARTPPHRDQPSAGPEHRWAMLNLALEGQQRLHPDDRELRRQGRSYMIDTVDSFSEQYGGVPCLILGQDAATGLDRWHRWRELLDRVHLVIMTRPGGHDLPVAPELSDLLNEREVAGPAQLRRSEGPALWRCQVSALEISATAIRRQLLRGSLPRYQVPGKVLNYIRKHALYRAESRI